MLIFLRAILFFALIIAFHCFHIKFTPQHHNIIQIYVITRRHMKLYRKKNTIINAVEHKGTMKEKLSHIETPGLVGDKGKTHYGENPFKLFLLLDRH